MHFIVSESCLDLTESERINLIKDMMVNSYCATRAIIITNLPIVFMLSIETLSCNDHQSSCINNICLTTGCL
jgi:hypothetical protein